MIKVARWTLWCIGLKKADTAFRSNMHLLCTRAVGLRKKFSEYVRRVVSVFLHGADGWAWSSAVHHTIRGFEGRCLSKILGGGPGKTATDDELKEWWQKHTRIARGLFQHLGFVLIEERCLAQIFQHSLKVLPRTNSDGDTISSAALTWKCQYWCDSNPDKTRHWPGRPRARWSDVFVRFTGTKWPQLVCQNLEAWKLNKQSFHLFCLEVPETQTHWLQDDWWEAFWKVSSWHLRI